MNRPVCLLYGILAVHIGLLSYSAAMTSPTTDEPSHLAAGIYTWRSGKCDLYPVNPPLVKAIASFPVFFLTGAMENWSRVSPPPARTEMDVGTDFIRANGSRIFWIITLARWACIPWSVLGAVICYRWSNQLFGSPCGWISLLLWCFSPTILGNGAVISADAASASVGVLAGYLFWQWLEEPTWEKAILNGAAMGLCWLVKLTWVILPGVWIFVWLLRSLVSDQKHRSMGRGISQILASVSIGIFVLNVGYGFEGTLTPLGDFQFTCSVLSGKAPKSVNPIPGNRFWKTSLGSIPVPLPSSFVYGLDAQKQDFEETRTLYFAGQRRTTGWWCFYLLAIFLKEPPGTLIVGFWATVYFLSRHDRWKRFRQLGAVWIPPLVVLTLVSTHPRLNYYRYLMPALPYTFVWLSQVGQRFHDATFPRWAIIVCVLSTVVSGGASVPHSMSYVNVFGGGTAYGHQWFADCNFDWGQDLPALNRWIKQHPTVEQIRVGYFGIVPPNLAGVVSQTLPDELMDPHLRPDDYQIPPGWYAISVSHVHGIEGNVFDSKGNGRTVFDAGLTIFESKTPIDRAGPSILIYLVE